MGSSGADGRGASLGRPGMSEHDAVGRALALDELLEAAGELLPLTRSAGPGQDLMEALHVRTMIGMAIGLVMERFDLDSEEAFEHLARLSRRSDLAVRDIAAHLVEQSNDLREWSRQQGRPAGHHEPDPPDEPQPQGGLQLPDEGEGQPPSD